MPATIVQNFQSLLNSGTSVCCFFFPLLVADIFYIKDIDVKVKWKGRFEKETWTSFIFNTEHQNSRPSRLKTADQSRLMEICSQPGVFRRVYSTRLAPAPQDSGRERLVTKFQWMQVDFSIKTKRFSRLSTIYGQNKPEKTKDCYNVSKSSSLNKILTHSVETHFS